MKDYPWHLRFVPGRVVDGDTLEGLVYLPIHATIPVLGMDFDTIFPMLVRVRLEGIDAPEDETVEGMAAQHFVEDWASWAGEVVFHTKGKRDPHGRWLGDLRWDAPARSLVDELLGRGMAVPYKPKPRTQPGPETVLP